MPILENLIEIAKKNLVKDGRLEPVFFLLRDEEFAYLPMSMVSIGRIYARQGHAPLNAEDTKTRDMYTIGGLAKGFRANRVVTIMDGAFRTIENPPAEYDDTEAPLSYPKSMRTEALTIQDMLLPSGESHVTVVALTRGVKEYPWNSFHCRRS
jgi:hypothetical protein